MTTTTRPSERASPGAPADPPGEARPAPDDERELLRAYAQDGSQAAFAALVGRYAGLVYGAALRQARDRQRAEDVTQAVFAAMARKARALCRHRALSAWLLTATGYAARTVVRAEARRAAREREVARMTSDRQAEPAPGDAGEWAEVTAALDGAMRRLGGADRDVLALRFFDGHDAPEIGRRLGLTPAAVRQRVARAVDRLRRLLAGRGVTVSAAAVAAVLAGEAARAAPAGVTAGAVTAGAAGPGTAAVAAATKGALAGLAWAQVKVAVWIVGALLLAGGALVAALRPVAKPVSGGGVVVEGIVRGPDGAPLARAEVLVTTARSTAMVYPQRRQDAPSVRTGSDGRFRLTLDETPLAIVVRAEEGYAQGRLADVRRDGGLTVEPWGAIEGTAGAGAVVRINRFPESAEAVWADWHVIHEAATRADAAGRFAFGRVAAGEVGVFVGPNASGAGAERIVSVTVRPAETVGADLGVAGRVQGGGTGGGRE